MISDVYFPRINGVSTSIRTFKTELEALGHRVTVIAPQYGNHDSAEKSIIRIPSRYLPLDPEDRLMKWKQIFELDLSYNKQQYDIIHIQTPFIAHYAGVSLAKKLGIPKIETYHTYFEEYLYHYIPFLPKPWMKYLARRFTRTQCNDLDALVVPSNAMLAVLRQYGVTSHAEIIPTGIELNKFCHSNGDGDKFRKKYRISGDRPTIVFIGRVAHEKNIDFLIHVLANVRINIPDVLLIIAGEGPALNSLKKLTRKLALHDNITFVGYLDRDKDLLDCYSAGNAFVFASNTETQGLVLLEAMALGIPLVSTAVMGTKDILSQAKGALVAEENIKDFSAKIELILLNSQVREQLSKEALEYVKIWSSNSMAQKLEQFYQKVIAGQLANAA